MDAPAAALLPLPLAASTGTAELLLDLFLVLLAAKIGDELFRRLRQPTLIGEILAGVAVGPAVLGLVEPSETLEVFSELGVVFILFWVGLETRLGDLLRGRALSRGGGRARCRRSVRGRLRLGAAGGEDSATSLFFAAALVATSVGITSAVLVDLGALRTRAGRTILGAAVVDDILAMLVVAVATSVAASGGADVGELVVTAVMALGFVAFFAFGGTRFMQRYPAILQKPRFSESPLLPAVLLCLAVAALAAEVGLAAVIGAFLAGMIVAETKEQHPIEDEVAPLYAFFAPFFFAYVGIQLDLDAYADVGTLAAVALVTVLAVVTKVVGAFAGARSLARGEALFVSAGMVPRGEVGIIVAGIGVGVGALSENVYAILVGMAVLTTLVAPPALRMLAGRLPDREAEPAQR